MSFRTLDEQNTGIQNNKNRSKLDSGKIVTESQYLS